MNKLWLVLLTVVATSTLCLMEYNLLFPSVFIGERNWASRQAEAMTMLDLSTTNDSGEVTKQITSNWANHTRHEKRRPVFDCESALYNKSAAPFAVRQPPSTDNTTHYELLELVKDKGCEVLKTKYRFPTRLCSAEERENPIAYSILVHDNPSQLSTLLSAIYAPHNLYCVHVDAKIGEGALFDAFKSLAGCFDNVMLASRREKVVYAGFARLQADLNCIEDLLARDQSWKYLVNLCGQDFPLRTNPEIVRQLNVLNGSNLIPGCVVGKNDVSTRRRTKFKYRVGPVTNDNGREELRMIPTNKLHASPPYNLTLKKNLAYNFFSRHFLEWVLHESAEAKGLLKWSEDTYSPDEHYWLMANSLPGAPGGSPDVASWWSVVRYIRWMYPSNGNQCAGYVRHKICVFASGDLYDLTQRHETFLNKVDVTRDADIVRCLRQWLDERLLGENRKLNPGRRAILPPYLKKKSETKKNSEKT